MLPCELDQIHYVFRVSMIRKYRTKPSHVVETDEVEVRLDLTCEEEPMKILAHEVKVLQSKSISSVKVLWPNHKTSKAIWETEETMKQQYI